MYCTLYPPSFFFLSFQRKALTESGNFRITQQNPKVWCSHVPHTDTAFESTRSGNNQVKFIPIRCIDFHLLIPYKNVWKGATNPQISVRTLIPWSYSEHSSFRSRVFISYDTTNCSRKPHTDALLWSKECISIFKSTKLLVQTTGQFVESTQKQPVPFLAYETL